MRGDTVATNTAMIALGKRTGFAVARKPEDGRLVQLVKNPTIDKQHARIFGHSLADRVVAA